MKNPKWLDERFGLNKVITHRREGTSALCEAVDLIEVYKRVCPRRVIRLWLPPGVLIWAHDGPSLLYRKCRANWALTGTGYGHTPLWSARDSSFFYPPDSVIVPRTGATWNPKAVTTRAFASSDKICAPGVHFFVARADANAYGWG